MNYETYRVEFYKRVTERDEKGRDKPTGELESLGSVTVDSYNTGPDLPLTTKAFRHASQTAQSADFVRTYRIYK